MSKLDKKAVAVKVFVPNDGYKTLAANKAAFAAFTISALEMAGLCKVSAKGLVEKLEGGSPKGWGAIVGSSARNYWKKQGWITDDGLTAQGLNTVSNRFASTSNKYGTNGDDMDNIRVLMKKGGTLFLDYDNPKGPKVEFNKPVTIYR